MVGNSHAIDAVLRPATIVLVVPPFAGMERPALGVHLLQAIARARGMDVQVFYANLWFAACFDERTHVSLGRTHHSLFLGERLFCHAAFGVPHLGHDDGADIDEAFAASRAECARRGVPFTMTRGNLRALAERVEPWLETFVPALAGYRVAGATTSFEQTGASLAILARVKQRAPHAITLLGGANCEGEMADGLAALAPYVDAIFDGESEQTFAELAAVVERGEALPRRIWRGTPCSDLDALPTPDFSDYYAQVRAFVPSLLPHTRINYETSRGCWWGHKSHCTFCGLNGQGMAPRHKSADRAIGELRQLLAVHPNREVSLTDNIMPHEYWKTFVPRLASELPGLKLMYELKANVTLAQMRALAAAGIVEVQPGIEALSTELLGLMKKGTTCAQNLALLRFARMTGIRLHWNLLAGFPNDKAAFYEETRALLPLIPHLPPPSGVTRVVIDRFSPYHAAPERHGVRDVRPLPGYHAWLPEGADVARIAYHFDASFESELRARPDLVDALDADIQRWRRRWIDGPVPQLAVVETHGGYELVDTRGLGLPERQPIDAARAHAALIARPLRNANRAEDAWARDARVVVERDDKLVPLALARPEVVDALDAMFRSALRVAS